MKLAGRTCLITGASQGLGRELAKRFWKEGASLALVSRSAADLDITAAALTPSLGDQQRCAVIAANLELPSEAERVKVEVDRQFSSVSVLINNAAILGPIGPSFATRADDWAKTFQINLFAPVRLCSIFVPDMRAKHYGKIINLSGGGAAGPRPNFSAYSSSKAALVRYSETLAHELTGSGIDVNCIAPGIMATGMTAQVIEAGPELAGSLEVSKAQESHEGTRSGLEQASNLAVFLASSDSDGLTGRLISAVWDTWEDLIRFRDQIQKSDVFTLRRIVPQDRGVNWNKQ